MKIAVIVNLSTCPVSNPVRLQSHKTSGQRKLSMETGESARIGNMEG